MWRYNLNNSSKGMSLCSWINLLMKEHGFYTFVIYQFAFEINSYFFLSKHYLFVQKIIKAILI